MTNFSELGLADPLLKSLSSEGYTTPTPIQAKAIPAVLANNDVLGIAQTGTGKTAAFALPVLHRLAAEPRKAPPKGCRVLVLSPTRELASQIADSFRTYGRNLRLSVGTVFGGVAQGPQSRMLAKGVDILVATPGRLLDHASTGVADLRSCEILILDEADQMLDLGFLPPIRKIVSRLPKQRQTLFFSATMPNEISRLANEFLSDPVRISVAPVSSTAARIDQQVIHVSQQGKVAVLSELLSDPAITRTLVFTRTKRGADRVAKHLDRSGIAAVVIHGNKSQNQRERALDAFRKAKAGVLVATDIAARGIDVDDVTHVINYELPDVPEAYVHRIGRTARAGASGCAISLCDPSERDQLRAIERLTRQAIPSTQHALGHMPAAPAPADTRRPRPPVTDSRRPKKQGGPNASSSRGRGRAAEPASSLSHLGFLATPSRAGNTSGKASRNASGSTDNAPRTERRRRRRRPARVAQAAS